MQVPEELEGMMGVASAIGAKKILEIGSCSGGTAAALASTGAKVVTMDIVDQSPWPWEEEEYKKQFPDASVYFVKGDSRTFYIASHVRPKFNEGEELYDLVFIDGEHSDLSGYMDFKNYGEMGKVIAIHDIHDWQTLRDDDWFPRTFWRMAREDGSFDLEDIVAPESTGGIGVIYLKDGDYLKLLHMFEGYLMKKLTK
jgi:hypothetical protein